MVDYSTAACMSDIIPFSDLCRFCDKLSSSEWKKRGDILLRYIQYYREFSAKVKKINPGINDSFYPVMRLLVPSLDRERGPYGIKEVKLAQIYVRILCLAKDSRDASKLQHFRNPSKAGKAAGDFADVIYDVLKSRISSNENLKISDVNQHLDNIANKNASNDPRGIDDELTILMRKMSASEQKWLVRMLLKDMKLGIGNNKILSTFHRDAVDLYDVSNCLKKVCSTLKDRNTHLHEIEVCLWDKFRPMLAQRCDVQNVDKDLPRQEYYLVEPKWDGERFQLHYGDGKFKYYTRKGFDYTNTYGENASQGNLSPYLSKQFLPSVKNCILDGEMMCWNSKMKNFTTKGAEIDVKMLKVGNVHNPCFCAFDILLLNDQVLTNMPLHDRVGILNRVFTPVEGIFMNTVRSKVTNKGEILSALNRAIDNFEEGIMIKNPFSVYKPNSRKDGWYKIKPEYTEGSMIELDVLIIGGYYGGEGRWRTAVTHFLYALAAPSSIPGENPTEFHSFGRVGSGCTQEELSELGAKLAPHWRRVKTGIMPPNIIWTKEIPDLWIEPKNSIILQVKATEAVPSDSFHVGHTLRFPRIQKVRDDKPWTDCLTVPEFFKILESSKGKLVSGHILATMSPLKKRAKKTIQQKPSLGSEFRSADVNNIEKLSSIFKGKEFCIFIDKEQKQEVETKIVQHGGNIAQNPGSDTFCIVTSNPKQLRIKNLIKVGDYTIAKLDWLERCFAEVKLIQWTPNDLIFMGKQAKEDLKYKYDQFSDSYVEFATESSLKETILAMRLHDDKVVFGMPKQMLQFEKKLLNKTCPYSFFRQCRAFFGIPADGLSSLNPEFETARLDFAFYGGILEKEISDSTTHTIYPSKHPENIRVLNSLKQARKFNYQIVSEKWVESCIEEKRMIDA
ncbi:unnamed protein product [Bemisia tabaci]|uniref:DNA ligase 4 n=1 Tax=Bemisia tabaci TaxID=7038 RepID=A0A9P0AD31_BEMTA|nr:unnamed protein product [Bemisia tabaci]